LWLATPGGYLAVQAVPDANLLLVRGRQPTVVEST